jgi:prepilin-type N-terminal cleavage/methylation domain-containing protein
MQMVRSKHHPRSGFTIVELLIVIVVIGILAVITVVAYNGIQARAQAANVQGALAQANKKLAAYMVDYSAYPTSQATFNTLVPGNTTTFEYTGTSTTYCVTATNGTTSYKSDSTTTQPAAGSCAGHASGGVAAITNYHRNPGATTATAYGSWAGDSGSTVTTAAVAAGWSLSGYAYRTTWTNVVGINGDIQVYLNNGSYLTAGSTYTLRYRVTAGQNSTIGAPGLYATAGVYTTIARSHTGNISLTSGVPVEVWLTFQCDTTALASAARVIHNSSTKANGYSFDLSEAVIYSGAYNSAVGYRSGDTANWLWNGAANNSTSFGPPT